jgi:Fe-S cluster biogenesis protein NfuA
MVGQPSDELGHSTGVGGSGPACESDGAEHAVGVACDGGRSELRGESDDIDEVVSELFGNCGQGEDASRTQRDPETDALMNRLTKDELTTADRIALREAVLELDDKATGYEDLRRDVRAIATVQRAIEEDIQELTDKFRTLERELEQLNTGRASELEPE